MTRREQITSRYAELQELRDRHTAALASAEAEMAELENELKETPADVLDIDTVSRKNAALRRAGLLP